MHARDINIINRYCTQLLAAGQKVWRDSVVGSVVGWLAVLPLLCARCAQPAQIMWTPVFGLFAKDGCKDQQHHKLHDSIRHAVHEL